MEYVPSRGSLSVQCVSNSPLCGRRSKLPPASLAVPSLLQQKRLCPCPVDRLVRQPYLVCDFGLNTVEVASERPQPSLSQESTGLSPSAGHTSAHKLAHLQWEPDLLPSAVWLDGWELCALCLYPLTLQTENRASRKGILLHTKVLANCILSPRGALPSLGMTDLSHRRASAVWEPGDGRAPRSLQTETPGFMKCTHPASY